MGWDCVLCWRGGKIGYVPRMLCVGMPTSNSCKTPEKVKTIILADEELQPRARRGRKMCRFIKL